METSADDGDTTMTSAIVTGPSAARPSLSDRRSGSDHVGLPEATPSVGVVQGSPHSEGSAHSERDKSEHEPQGEETYSTFSRSTRLCIIASVTFAGFFSPLTSAIYLPAVPQVAHDLSQSIEAINLTLTVFMVFQGVSPLLFGPMADHIGRRPVFLVCLVLYEMANVAIANLPNSYVALMVLRCIQASGSASSISVGAGAIGDVTRPSERGGVMGIFQAGLTFGPAIGPLFGGVLTDAFGWRGIFWFLFILSAVGIVFIFVLLPETLRSLVGNGSLPAPTVWHESLWMLLRGQTAAQKTGRPRPGLQAARERSSIPHTQTARQLEAGVEGPNEEDVTPSHTQLPRQSLTKRICHSGSRFLSRTAQPLLFFAVPEMLLCLAINSIPYVAYYMVIGSLSDIFQRTYNLSTLQVGLVFLGPGVSTIGASLLIGRLMDRHWKRDRGLWEEKREQRRRSGGEAGGDDSISGDGSGEGHSTGASDANVEAAVASAVAAPSAPIDPPDGNERNEKHGAQQDGAQPDETRTITRASSLRALAAERQDEDDEDSFQMERARFRTFPFTMGASILCLIGYGWSLHYSLHISLPIIFTSVLSFSTSGIFAIIGTQLVDYAPTKGASVTAANNLFRCTCGAAGTAVIKYLLNALGTGWTFTLVAGYCACSLPMAWGLVVMGPKWRKARRIRARSNKEGSEKRT